MHQLRPLIRNLRSMHVSKTFLQKVYFILKTMPASLHRLNRTSRSSFPAAFVVPFPEQGVTSHNLIHSAEVRYFSHKRTYPCCQPGVLSRPHFLGVRPSIRSKPITVLLRDPAYPPFCRTHISPVDIFRSYGFTHDMLWTIHLRRQSALHPGGWGD